jgi:hypothetical protein
MSSLKIEMTFECSQDWDSMKPTSCGKFCSMCNKEVIDFTFSGRLQEIDGKREPICGSFYPYQLDNDLLGHPQLSFRKKILVLLSGLLFLCSGRLPAQEKDSLKTEQHPASQPDPVNRGKITVRKEGVLPLPVPELGSSYNYSAAAIQPFLRTKKRDYYWSRRFPFVRSYLRGRRMGNVRML